MIAKESTAMATTMRVVGPRGFARSQREERNADPVRGASGYQDSAARRTRARSCRQPKPRGRSSGRRGLGTASLSTKLEAGECVLLCSVAVFSILFFPNIVASSIRASMSSLEWNRGNFRVRKNSRIIPADQTSMAVRQGIRVLRRAGRRHELKQAGCSTENTDLPFVHHT